jgi:hypothetical protein
MRPKQLLTFFSLTLLAFACTDVNSNKIASGKSWLDTLAYPKQRFFSVTLFTLDADQKTTISSDSGTFVDTSVLEYVGNAGYSFVDKQGIPKTNNFHSFKFDSTQIKRLESFLVQQPCTDSIYLDKACAPTYKNVVVFYDENKKAIAQVHICFQCEKASFYPYSAYMCDFDNKVNFKDLKGFIDSVKLTN